MITEHDTFKCDLCGSENGEYNTNTGNHITCEELEEVRSYSCCAYCGEKVKRDNEGAILNHILTCKERPELKLIEAASEAEELIHTYYREALKTIGIEKAEDQGWYFTTDAGEVFVDTLEEALQKTLELKA